MYWFIPAILCAPFVAMMLRPLPRDTSSNFGDWTPIYLALRLFWLIPILAIWLAYVAVLLIVHYLETPQ